MAFEYSNNKYISDTACPHCNKQSTYKSMVHANDHISEATLVYDDKEFYFPYFVNFQVFQCEYCDRYRLIVERIKIYSEGGSKEETILEFPFPGFSGIDREKINYPIILESLDEGMRCLAANSSKGAIVNFRRALQAATLLLGGKGKDLQEQIDDLYKKEVIRGRTRDIAHKVRAFGNLGAHPFEIDMSEGGKVKADNFSKLTLEDALQAAKILVLFLEDAFVYPTKLDKIDQRLNELKNNK